MQYSSRPFLIIAILAVAAAIGIGVAVRRGDDPAKGSIRISTGSRAPAKRGQQVLPPAPNSDAVELGTALPPSLRETEIDGWIGVDDDGHLIVTPGVRWFFDYFLSATGEESDDDIRARIEGEIERRLPPDGAREATALLDRYLRYRERVRDAQPSGVTGDLAQRLAELHRIRVEAFGPTDAAILFGEEEQMQSADLQRRAVMSDTSLTPAQREQRLSEIEQQLPEPIRAARADTFAPLHLRQDEQALREAGGSDADVQTLRTQRFGPEAAERLAALDREQAQWRQRVDDYQRARQRIAADTSLTASARTQALEALIAQRFTAQERLRVEAGEEKPRINTDEHE